MKLTTRVCRFRWVIANDTTRKQKVHSDVVLIGLDEFGRMPIDMGRIPLGVPTVLVAGGVCYAGWKRMTGITLIPNRIHQAEIDITVSTPFTPLPVDSSFEDLEDPKTDTFTASTS